MPYIESADISTANKEIVQPAVRILHVLGDIIGVGLKLG